MLPLDKRYIILEDRVTWLEENLAGQRWDITRFVDPATLIHISTARCTKIYFPFILANLNQHGVDLFKNICFVDFELCYTEDSTSLIQASFQERDA